ncbi:MAG: hypothetical protein SXA11_08770 [Cyanobacteriota bacterium]|nr:hypothetical protein [Cyanobacteriota bacterium]
MTQISVEKDTALSRISAIVEDWIQNETVFHNLKKPEIIKIFSNLLDKTSPTQVLSLDDEELTNRVNGVMAIEAMSHLLDDNAGRDRLYQIIPNFSRLLSFLHNLGCDRQYSKIVKNLLTIIQLH